MLGQAVAQPELILGVYRVELNELYPGVSFPKLAHQLAAFRAAAENGVVFAGDKVTQKSKADELRTRTYNFWACAQGTDHEIWLKERMEASEADYRSAVAAYNLCMRQRENRIPARLLGMHEIEEEPPKHMERP